MATVLVNAATATGAAAAITGEPKTKTYQAWGATSAGAGAATIVIQGTHNAGASWDTIGTITLTLGTTTTSDSFTSEDRYSQLRGNVTAISGTGATVTAGFF